MSHTNIFIVVQCDIEYEGGAGKRRVLLKKGVSNTIKQEELRNQESVFHSFF